MCEANFNTVIFMKLLSNSIMLLMNYKFILMMFVSYDTAKIVNGRHLYKNLIKSINASRIY